MSADEPLRMTVDGEVFEISRPDDSPDSYDFAWLTGPNPQYGFGLRSHPPVPLGPADLEEAIRDFLSQVDPDTGFIE
ncbi:hypothetical protein ACIO93_11740 [Streptomyces sp. NPDC087903]|uniref:hypothetical protein n=1 Tax=Streptomyces sp. NPDC087903 TaxID=3365819 RepID=UPI00380FF82E